jgi:hypothetical protein
MGDENLLHILSLREIKRATELKTAHKRNDPD